VASGLDAPNVSDRLFPRQGLERSARSGHQRKGQRIRGYVELPGLDEKDVEVKLANGSLTVKGEKKEDKEEREKDYYFSERRYGSFVRSFPLPEGVNADKIEASFAKGVLTIKLPKTAEAQAEKKIAVKAA
jgi:HSP20 family protein